jgi:hypothetical protein
MKSTFPKQVLCDSISYRPGTLMHSKVRNSQHQAPIIDNVFFFYQWTVYHCDLAGQRVKHTVSSQSSKQAKQRDSGMDVLRVRERKGTDTAT